LVACGHPIGSEGEVLEGLNLACVRGSRQLFSDLSFAVRPGELLWVTGPNGSGKTSLLRIVCTLGPAERGEVRWRGAPVRELGESFRAQLFYLGHAAAVKDDLSALENLRYAMAQQGVPAAGSQLGEALEAFGLGGREAVPARALSQGQRRRVALSRLWFGAVHPLWVLDEPLTALDAAAVRLVHSLLLAHLARGGCVLLTSHQEMDLGGAPVQRIRLDDAR
jgi:heme exporter protein A